VALYKEKRRTSFTFWDIRRIIAEAALSGDFGWVCPKPGNPPNNQWSRCCYVCWLDEFLWIGISKALSNLSRVRQYPMLIFFAKTLYLCLRYLRM
jgi:hypothetical protein